MSCSTKKVSSQHEGAKAPRVWMTLAGEVRRRGQELMHQQCWCWGADIRRAEGDWLLQLGFEKTRPPYSKKGSNTYQVSTCAHEHITLWGFGMCFGHAQKGRVFVSRYGFFPRFHETLMPNEAIWKVEQTIDVFAAPHNEEACYRSIELLESALLWMANYERNVLEQLGPSYRNTTLGNWAHVAQTAETMPAAWEALAHQIRPHARLWRRDENGLHQLPLEQ